MQHTPKNDFKAHREPFSILDILLFKIFYFNLFYYCSYYLYFKYYKLILLNI